MSSDSDRLRALWQQKATISQREFARRYGIGTPSMVSQYLNGLAPLNLPAAVKFARGLGVSLAEISPTLAREALEAAELAGGDNFSPVPETPPPSLKLVPLVSGNSTP